MNERTLKRLLIIVVASILIILAFKSMMLKTAVSLNKVVVDKKQTSATTPTPQPDAIPLPDVLNVIEIPPVSAPTVGEAMELPVASGVGEARGFAEKHSEPDTDSSAARN